MDWPREWHWRRNWKNIAWEQEPCGDPEPGWSCFWDRGSRRSWTDHLTSTGWKMWNPASFPELLFCDWVISWLQSWITYLDRSLEKQSIYVLAPWARCHICHACVSPFNFRPLSICLHWVKEDLHEESNSPFLKLFLFALNFLNQQVRWASFDFLKITSDVCFFEVC